MEHAQNGILAPLTNASRYLFLELKAAELAPAHLQALAEHCDGETLLVGIGEDLVRALGCSIPGLQTFAGLSGVGVHAPSTPCALWLWLRGDAPGELLRRGHELATLLAPAFAVCQEITAFKHDGGRDLTGYEDGTENPDGDDAVRAALLQDAAPGLAGSSFVAVQQWLHDFTAFGGMSRSEQDDSVGRRLSDNEEIDEAPRCAHVKRAAQESFDPEAFMLRRSSAWVDGAAAGLVFVAFGHSFQAFEMVLRRMLGLEDGTVDALFRFTRPQTGMYFWCPPMRQGRLDLSAIGLR